MRRLVKFWVCQVAYRCLCTGKSRRVWRIWKYFWVCSLPVKAFVGRSSILEASFAVVCRHVRAESGELESESIPSCCMCARYGLYLAFFLVDSSESALVLLAALDTGSSDIVRGSECCGRLLKAQRKERGLVCDAV